MGYSEAIFQADCLACSIGGCFDCGGRLCIPTDNSRTVQTSTLAAWPGHRHRNVACATATLWAAQRSPECQNNQQLSPAYSQNDQQGRGYRSSSNANAACLVRDIVAPRTACAYAQAHLQAAHVRWDCSKRDHCTQHSL